MHLRRHFVIDTGEHCLLLLLLLGLLRLRSTNCGIGRERFVFNAIAFLFPVEEIGFFESTAIDGGGKEIFQELIVGFLFVAKFLDVIEELLNEERRLR